MEWNLKPSSLWEWENLFELEAKPNDDPNKLQERRDYFVELDRGISSESLHSLGNGGGSTAGTGGSGSDFGHASSKSSVSASINSSSIGESKDRNKFTLDGFEPFVKDSKSEKESAKVQHLGSSLTPEVSVGSGEPLLSLKLGKRMYFKDICSERSDNVKTPFASAATTVKRSKSACQSTQASRCQVEGCNLDLSSAKDYHRKHRICESHSKSPRIVVGGVERRFCQQCSRFHGLSEFDEKKRSCRRRLSDHNARRRKPQPEAVQLNPARFSSPYDEQPKMTLVFNHAPHLFTGYSTNITWDDHGCDGSKLKHTREYLSRPVKSVAADEMRGNVAMLYPRDSSRQTPDKGTGHEFVNPGLEESMVSTELNSTPDLHRALSLLSTSSRGGSRETKPDSHEGSRNDMSHGSGVVRPALQLINHGSVPLGSTEFWQAEQPGTATEPATFLLPHRDNGNGLFEDHLHLFKPPNESGFYAYQF